MARAYGLPELVCAAVLWAPVAYAAELRLPAACDLGKDCFVQQFPDMDSGSGVEDPYCGMASYDGHTGTDLRVLSMKDVARGVPVVSMSDGRVLRIRDGEPDRLVSSPDDKAAVSSRECGNGAVIRHSDGIEAQYCHLKQGSLTVEPGEHVAKGDRIGEIGASGLAQFPHVHVTLRRDGQTLDPFTGRPLGSGCHRSSEPSQPLFSKELLDRIGKGETQLMSFGIAGSVVQHEELVVSGPPPLPDSSSPALVAWAWLQNLREGDRIAIELSRAEAETLAAGTTAPMERSKAIYSAYVGKRGVPAAGEYLVSVTLLRNGAPVFTKTSRHTIR